MADNIILASGSPRRIELIKKLGLDNVTAVPADIEEIIPDGLSPEDAVSALALQKAKTVAAAVEGLPSAPGSGGPSAGAALIIGADTMVYVDGIPLGKPADVQDAARMLRMLSNRRHSVYTGIALLRGNKQKACAERTDVKFRALSETEIRDYIATGEPMDKAGAYAAQEGAASFIECIEGDFWNIVGLPLCRLSLMLNEFIQET